MLQQKHKMLSLKIIKCDRKKQKETAGLEQAFLGPEADFYLQPPTHTKMSTIDVLSFLSYSM